MVLTFDNVNFFFKFIRQFLASIDVVVFSLLSWMIEGVFNLSSLTVNSDFAKEIYTRIYIILGIFMVFKLSFSFLKYLVSPDSMTDKEQGVGKLVARIVTMIVMLIAFPLLFFNPVPGDLQNRTILGILQDGVVKTLPRIILGQKIDDTNASTSMNTKDNGKQLALAMLKSFYYPSVCNEDSKNYDTKQTAECSKYFKGESASISDKGLEESGINDFKTFYSTVINEGENDTYSYQYMWPLTTVSGILLIVIMAGICIDVAIRCFKLLILEVMAPVPIMTYIDPKASKDGSFATWSKSLISTYIDLFVKLGTVYLVLLLANAIFSGRLLQENNLTGLSWLYVQVFLVIGLFQFAKQAPKFIKDALGIKDNGGGGFMDSLKTLGAAAGLAGGAAVGAIGGLAGGAAAAKAAGNNAFTSALKGLGGGISGAVRGGYQGGKGAAKGNPFAGTAAALATQNAVTQRKMTAAQNGSTFFGRMGTRANEFFTGQTPADKDQAKLDKLEEEKAGYDIAAQTNGNLYDYIMDKGAKQGASTVVAAKHSKHGTLAISYDNFNSAYQNAKQNGLSSFSITTASGHTVTMDTFSGDTAKFASDLQEASANQWAKNNASDPMLQRFENDAGVVNGTYTATTLKNTKKNAEADSRSVTASMHNIKTSKGYKANRANAAAVKRNGN